MSKKATPNPNYIEGYNLKDGLIYKCKTLEEYEEKREKMFKDMLKKGEITEETIDFVKRNNI